MASPLQNPALLAFAGNMLSRGNKGQIGFGQALGAGLSGLAQSQLMQQQMASQRNEQLMAAAERAINMRAAIGSMQKEQFQMEALAGQQEAQQAYVQSLPEDQRLAAAASPQEAISADIAGNAPISPVQQAQLDQKDVALGQGQQQIDLAKSDSEFAQAFKLAERAAGAPVKLSDVAGVRKEFTKNSTEYSSVRDAYKRILSTKDGPAGDLSLVFGYMKMLDPGSVVREGEFATAENTAGVSDRIRNMYNKLASGERLGPAQREEFRSQASDLYTAQYDTQKGLFDQYGQIADRAGIRREDVLQGVVMETPDALQNQAMDGKLKSAGISLMDIDETAAKHGITPDQVIQELTSRGVL